MKEIITLLTDWKNIIINNVFNCKTKDYDLCFNNRHSTIRILMFNLKDYKYYYRLNGLSVQENKSYTLDSRFVTTIGTFEDIVKDDEGNDKKINYIIICEDLFNRMSKDDKLFIILHEIFHIKCNIMGLKNASRFYNIDCNKYDEDECADYFAFMITNHILNYKNAVKYLIDKTPNSWYESYQHSKREVRRDFIKRGDKMVKVFTNIMNDYFKGDVLSYYPYQTIYKSHKYNNNRTGAEMEKYLKDMEIRRPDIYGVRHASKTGEKK